MIMKFVSLLLLIFLVDITLGFDASTCGIEKICYFEPPKCNDVGEPCSISFSIQWNERQRRFLMELAGFVSDDQYAAVVISQNTGWQYAEAYLCSDNGFNSGHIINYEQGFRAYSTPNEGVNVMKTGEENGFVACAFTREPIVHHDIQSFTLPFDLREIKFPMALISGRIQSSNPFVPILPDEDAVTFRPVEISVPKGTTKAPLTRTDASTTPTSASFWLPIAIAIFVFIAILVMVIVWLWRCTLVGRRKETYDVNPEIPPVKLTNVISAKEDDEEIIRA